MEAAEGSLSAGHALKGRSFPDAFNEGNTHTHDARDDKRCENESERSLRVEGCYEERSESEQEEEEEEEEEEVLRGRTRVMDVNDVHLSVANAEEIRSAARRVVNPL